MRQMGFWLLYLKVLEIAHDPLNSVFNSSSELFHSVGIVLNQVGLDAAHANKVLFIHLLNLTHNYVKSEYV